MGPFFHPLDRSCAAGTPERPSLIPHRTPSGTPVSPEQTASGLPTGIRPVTRTMARSCGTTIGMEKNETAV